MPLRPNLKLSLFFFPGHKGTRPAPLRPVIDPALCMVWFSRSHALVSRLSMVWLVVASAKALGGHPCARGFYHFYKKFPSPSFSTPFLLLCSDPSLGVWPILSFSSPSLPLLVSPSLAITIEWQVLGLDDSRDLLYELVEVNAPLLYLIFVFCASVCAYACLYVMFAHFFLVYLYVRSQQDLESSHFLLYKKIYVFLNDLLSFGFHCFSVKSISHILDDIFP